MSDATNKCQVGMMDGEPCGRELYDEDCCILHSKKEGKDLKLFIGAFHQAMKEESPKAHDFTGFAFPEGAALPREFSKPVSFGDAVFEGEANFAGVAFKGRVSFRNATFKSTAYLSIATFEEIVYFGGARFRMEACFDATIFKGAAFFAEAAFKGISSFGATVFQDRADFEETRFQSGADFNNSLFKGHAHFLNTVFEGQAQFRGATFEDSLLINAEGQERKAFKEDVDFRSVTFLKPENVQLQKVDLSKFRFLETDLREVHFTDVDWYRDKDKGRNRVFDEVLPDPDTKEFDYPLVAQLYRQLRANYEQNLRYSEAGDFYIGEMEMTRKAQTSIFKELPLLFYKAISSYGESYYRPLCWIGAILLLFPILFMFAGIRPVTFGPGTASSQEISYRLDVSSLESVAPAWDELGDYYTCFLYSMSVFSFIRDKKYTTMNSWGHTLFVAESVLGPVTLAFFLLALRRRFKR